MQVDDGAATSKPYDSTQTEASGRAALSPLAAAYHPGPLQGTWSTLHQASVIALCLIGPTASAGQAKRSPPPPPIPPHPPSASFTQSDPSLSAHPQPQAASAPPSWDPRPAAAAASHSSPGLEWPPAPAPPAPRPAVGQSDPSTAAPAWSWELAAGPGPADVDPFHHDWKHWNSRGAGPGDR